MWTGWRSGNAISVKSSFSASLPRLTRARIAHPCGRSLRPRSRTRTSRDGIEDRPRRGFLRAGPSQSTRRRWIRPPTPSACDQRDRRRRRGPRPVAAGGRRGYRPSTPKQPTGRPPAPHAAAKAGDHAPLVRPSSTKADTFAPATEAHRARTREIARARCRTTPAAFASDRSEPCTQN